MCAAKSATAMATIAAEWSNPMIALIFADTWVRTKMNTTKCESCGGKATKCCGKDDMPMLWFCARCYRIHVRAVHGGFR